VLLLHAQVCFTWVWCDAGVCDEAAYQEAMNVVWKLIICLTLFSVAGFIKCSLARLLSYQFYRTAHFQKVKQAIERVSGSMASRQDQPFHPMMTVLLHQVTWQL
jgi:hypothetical protein